MGRAEISAVAMNVRPARISLPTRAGAVLPQDFLKEPWRSQFLDVHARRLEHHAQPEPTCACHRVDANNEIGFYTTLRNIGFGDFVDEG